MTEKQLQQAVLDYARLTGWLAYHTHDSRRSQPGFPDLAMVRGERLVFSELKSAGGHLTSDQVRWLDALRATVKPEVYIWRPGHWTNGTVEQTLR